MVQEEEEVDEAEFQLLEAALQEAEQQYAAHFESKRSSSCAGNTARAVPASAGYIPASTALRDAAAEVAVASGAVAAAIPPPQCNPPATSSSGVILGSEATGGTDTGGALSGGFHTHAAAAPAPGKRKLPASFVCGPTASTAAGVVAQQLPTLVYMGAVQYAYTAVEVDALCQLLLGSNLAHCGFDIEWLVTYQAGQTPRPVALVQLCLQEPAGYRCLLLHVARSGITPHLRQLLCCKDIVKVGVGAHGDSLKVQRDFGIAMEGVLDLSDYANARLSGDGAAPQKWSLAGLTKRLMKRTLTKAQGLRCSDWEAFPLSAEQRKYAAADVFASLRAYEILEQMPVVWQPTALLPAPELHVHCIAGGCEAEQQVPACSEVAPLQPAKLQVYTQHVQQGLALQQIAELRHIKEDSVQGYLAEAITAGYAYSWKRLGVPDTTLACVAALAGKLLERELACEPPQQHQKLDTVVQGNQGQQPDSQPQPLGANGTCANRAASSRGVVQAGKEGATAGSCPPAQQTGTATAVPAAAGLRPVDVLQALLEKGAKIRELKEQHWEDIPYGHLRLTLAHLGRCNPGPWEPS
ncbi:hypothetical protein N2152v2_006225 [Parachlorella kessleri]